MVRAYGHVQNRENQPALVHLGVMTKPGTHKSRITDTELQKRLAIEESHDEDTVVITDELDGLLKQAECEHLIDNPDIIDELAQRSPEYDSGDES